MENAMEDPIANADIYSFFAFVIEGEVVLQHAVEKKLEMVDAIYSSTPLIVKLTADEATFVSQGYLYTDGKFSAPLED